MLSRIIWSWIQAGERNKGICALQGHTLEGVNQCSTDDRADAVDRAQVRDMLFAIWVYFDQFFYSLVDARNDLIEAFSKRLEFGGESVHSLEATCRVPDARN